MAISVTEQFSGSVENQDLISVAFVRSDSGLVAKVNFEANGEVRTLTFSCPSDLKNQIASLAKQAVSNALGL